MASSRARPGKSKTRDVDAISLLKRDHRDVEKMFDAFEEADGGETKSGLARRICRALAVHAQIEEELFYPALRHADADAEGALDEAEVEHASAKQLIADIESMESDDELFDAKVTVLGEYVRHHVKEEEGEIFKKAKSADLDLDELGARMARRKGELMEYESEELAEQDEN